MNTFRIYEDFKASLGEAAAKSLAQTLGTMFEELRDTVTKEDFRILRESIDANTSRLDAALARLAEAQSRTEAKVAELAEGQARLAEAQSRTEARVAELAEGQNRLAEAQSRTEAKVAELAEAQRRTDVRLSELAEAQSRTEAKVTELAEAQRRTDVRLSELAEAQSRTEARVAELAEAQCRTEAEVQSLTIAVQRLTIRTDTVLGRTLELQFRDRLTSYLGRFLRRGKLLANVELIDTIEPHVTGPEVDDLLRADAIASGLVDGQQAYVVVEVSSTGEREDIVRAQRRAGVLRKAGLAAIPLIACEAIAPESLAFARTSQVKVWCNGSLLDADAAA